MLTKADLDRAQGAQLLAGSGLATRRFDPTSPASSAGAEFTLLGGGEDDPLAANRDAEESLWWHARTCTWTHPEL